MTEGEIYKAALEKWGHGFQIGKINDRKEQKLLRLRAMVQGVADK